MLCVSETPIPRPHTQWGQGCSHAQESTTAVAHLTFFLKTDFKRRNHTQTDQWIHTDRDVNMLWTDSQQKRFFGVEAFFLLCSGRAEKFDLSGLESAAHCFPRGSLGRQRNRCGCWFNGSWSCYFHNHWVVLFAIRKPSGSPSKVSLLGSFFHLCHPGKVAFHSAIDVFWVIFLTLRRCGSKWQNRDLEIPVPTESLKLTSAEKTRDGNFVHEEFFSLLMSLDLSPLLSKFRYWKICAFIHRDLYWHDK